MLTLVQPIQQYFPSVWDPHLIKDINEKTAWWVISDYIYRSSVTFTYAKPATYLQWPTLSNHRYNMRILENLSRAH